MPKIVIGLAAAAFLVQLPGSARASPPGTACPGGSSDFVLWAEPIYVVTDDDGNPFQIYNFLDNKF